MAMEMRDAIRNENDEEDGLEEIKAPANRGDNAEISSRSPTPLSQPSIPNPVAHHGKNKSRVVATIGGNNHRHLREADEDGGEHSSAVNFATKDEQPLE